VPKVSTEHKEQVRQRLIDAARAVVLREGHPLASAREVSAEQLANLPQLEISSAQFGSDFSEDSTQPKRRLRPAVRAPILSAAQILSASDMAAVLPINVAKEMMKSRALTFRRPSRLPKPIEAAMIWPRRLDNQPAHAWLRDVISNVANDFRAT